MAGSLGYGHRGQCLPSGILTLEAEPSLGWHNDHKVIHIKSHGTE